MYSISFARIVRKALALVACTGALLALATGPVLAAVTIEAASWDGVNVNANGLADSTKGKNGAGPVELVDADSPAPGVVIGTDNNVKNNRVWSISGTCASNVYARQDGATSATIPVTGADCGGPVNDPPVCTIDTPPGDPIIFEGDTVDYTGTATDTPPGSVEDFLWIFEGGDLGSSTQEDPGFVTYSTAGTYTTTFDAIDNDGASCSPAASRTITVQAIGEPPVLPKQTDFKMMMNYELGMHCTGFEFAYCCVLPVYNSILTQVVKPQNGIDFPHLLEEAPNHNVASILDGGTGDVLNRHTVVRDKALDENGDFAKYVLRYWHDAQPRDDGNGKPQSSTLISDVEGNSLLSWNTVADAAKINPPAGDPDYNSDFAEGAMISGSYNGAKNVVLGNDFIGDVGPTFGAPIDNYQNVVWNHLYIYTDTEGNFACTAGDTGKHCYALSSDPHAECDTAPGAGDGVCGINTLEANKVRLGLDIDYPTNFGPAGHNMEGLLTFSGDTGTVVFTQMKVLENLPVMLTSPRIWEALGLPLTPFEDSIDFFMDPGQVDEDSIRPYVQMKAQLYHADCDANGNCVEGIAVLDSADNPVIGFGTAPIDIPNCERCHSASPCTDPDLLPSNSECVVNPNSPNSDDTAWALVQQEMDFWNSYYDIDTDAGDSDWYSRLKGAAISILSGHDLQHGTSFTLNYPGTGALRPATCERGKSNTTSCSLHSQCDTDPAANGGLGSGDGQCDIPQNTRIGHESVICQKCHADNVIAVVKSANCGPEVVPGTKCEVTATDQLFENISGNNPLTGEGHLIPPLTEALHWNHRETSEGGTITMTDAQGRSGGCQGCHPAHRSDGDMSGYPITLDGDNFYADGDNRDANGGCFVGRDVHSNPIKDIDGAETPEHLNAVGQWLSDNVYSDAAGGEENAGKGIWCSNCHTQAGQQLWKAENVADLVNAKPGDPGHVREPSADASLGDVVAAVNAALGTSTSLETFESWLDPRDPALSPNLPSGGTRTDNHNSAIWAPDPGICNHAASVLGLGEASAAQDGNVATIEINMSGDSTNCSTGIGLAGPDCFGTGDPSFFICGTVDADGDVSVNVMDFCTTGDCTGAHQGTLDGGIEYDDPDNPTLETLTVTGSGQLAIPVPMSAATDGRDHWLSPGEPHCADCHAAPYVEQSGNVNFFPPFNYPKKASLMRYSRGHQDITCQGCHESTHGLYPVTPTIDTTSYAQAASLNHDGSHGPLKCGTCHDVDGKGIPVWMSGVEYNGKRVRTFDDAVSWAHTFTAEVSPLDDGGVCMNCHGDRVDKISETSGKWLRHSFVGRISRHFMDKAEVETLGDVAGGSFVDDDDLTGLQTVCSSCHSLQGGPSGDFIGQATCDNQTWKLHNLDGRLAEKVWEYVSVTQNGSTCGW